MTGNIMHANLASLSLSALCCGLAIFTQLKALGDPSSGHSGIPRDCLEEESLPVGNLAGETNLVDGIFVAWFSFSTNEVNLIWNVDGNRYRANYGDGSYPYFSICEYYPTSPLYKGSSKAKFKTSLLIFEPEASPTNVVGVLTISQSAIPFWAFQVGAMERAGFFETGTNRIPRYEEKKSIIPLMDIMRRRGGD